VSDAGELVVREGVARHESTGGEVLLSATAVQRSNVNAA
jgi:hypothetical protein